MRDQCMDGCIGRANEVGATAINGSAICEFVWRTSWELAHMRAVTVWFHSCPILLGPGSLILPGNYGRVIEARGTDHPHWKREALLEEIRAAEFREKPSRLSATFSCPTLESACAYRHAMALKGGFQFQRIYKVEKFVPDAPEHCADFNTVELLPRRNDTCEDAARLYWRSALWTNVLEYPGIRLAEIVTSSPLRVKALLTI
jgi:hypothetical protein